MVELIETNWVLIAIALTLGLVVAWYVFHASRRTRITGTSRDVLDEDSAPAERNRALIDAPPATAREDSVTISPSASEPPSPSGPSAGPVDDLTRLKGVGPKLAARLREIGVSSIDEIAAWDEADIDRVDAQLGRFSGRIRQDSWVEQARLLAAGETGAYAEKYGNLS